MALNAAAQAELSRLRRNIADIEGRLAESDRIRLEAAATERFAARDRPADAASLRPMVAGEDGRVRLKFGVTALDAALGGGLPLSTLHEVRSKESRDDGAASGFVMALATRLTASDGPPSIVFISESDVRRESGRLYAPGLAALGLDPFRIVEVAVKTEGEALWAFEAALACRGVGVAICELRQKSLDLSATRRCVLRARETGVTGFLLRLGHRSPEPSAAELRFRIIPLPAGEIGGFSAGVGRMAWRVKLEKNRLGRTGAFSVEWNAHERSFADRASEREAWRADPQPLPAASSDRSSDPSATSLRRAS